MGLNKLLKLANKTAFMAVFLLLLLSFLIVVSYKNKTFIDGNKNISDIDYAESVFKDCQKVVVGNTSTLMMDYGKICFYDNSDSKSANKLVVMDLNVNKVSDGSLLLIEKFLKKYYPNDINQIVGNIKENCNQVKDSADPKYFNGYLVYRLDNTNAPLSVFDWRYKNKDNKVSVHFIIPERK